MVAHEIAHSWTGALGQARQAAEGSRLLQHSSQGSMRCLSWLCSGLSFCSCSCSCCVHVGNLVTNASWEHFWLNEGWTVFLERKIVGWLQVGPTQPAPCTCRRHAVWWRLPDEHTHLRSARGVWRPGCLLAMC